MNCSDLLLIAALLHEAWYHGASLHTTLNLLNEWGERSISLRRWAAMMSWRSRPHACLTMILRCLLVVCAITMSTTPHEHTCWCCHRTAWEGFPGQRRGATVYSAPPELQGRGGAVRVRRGNVDFCFVAVYFHPDSPLPYLQRVNDALWRWVAKTVESLPARCVPVVLGDFNARVGRVHAERQLFDEDDTRAIGSFNPEVRNCNGAKLSQFLQTQFMCAINTFYDCGPTFFGIVAGCTSRIDYICLPQSLCSPVVRCCIWHAAGDELQLVAAPGRRDHRPVQLVLEHSLCHAPQKVHRRRWETHGWSASWLAST